MDLNLIWFALLGVLLTGYAILDGFDLGVGALHLLARTDTERRTLLNAIGPFWDGNEVWLVTFGGALFGCFPNAYAAAFSSFYLPFMFLLFCLIFRAVAIEFRSKENWAWWRSAWDVAFSIASVVATVLFGVAIGNMMIGLKIDAAGNYIGTFLHMLNGYAILVGVFALSLFMVHGSLYLYLKTEGELQQRMRRAFWPLFLVFVFLYLVTTLVTLATIPTSTHNFKHHAWAWIVVVLDILAIANLPRGVYRGWPVYAFISSACVIAAKVFLFGIAIFPNLVVAQGLPSANITIYNGASSQGTLTTMLIIAVMGMPFVLAYTISIYWIFRGKVRIGSFSY